MPDTTWGQSFPHRGRSKADGAGVGMTPTVVESMEGRAARWCLPEGLPRRWLILTQYYAPEPGAPQVRLRALVRVLKELGLEVEVFTAMPNYPTGVIPYPYRGRWRFREMIDGVPVHRSWVYPYGGGSALHRLINYFSFTAGALFALFGRRRPDVVFIESQPLPIGILGLLGRIIWRTPYIYNIPDLQIEAARDLGYVRMRWILDIAAGVENMFIRNSWRTSTVTWSFRDLYHERRGIPRYKLTMLPNGADTQRLGYREPDHEVIARFNLEGKTVFLYAGTITGAHAPQVMIDAAELLRDRDDLRILIVGGGPKRPLIESSAREKGLRNVVFGPEAFTQEELPALMSVARAALVTLSETPTHPRLRVAKTWPALACRKAVICSGDCESSRMVRENDCGLVTAYEDPRELAEAMIRLADDPQEAERLGRNGQMFVQRELSWKTIVQGWLDELMAKRSVRRSDAIQERRPLRENGKD